MARSLKKMTWFCLFSDFYNNRKILTITDEKYGFGIDKAERLFIRLLCICNDIDCGGLIHLTPGVPMPMRILAKQADEDIKVMEAYINAAVEVGLLKRLEDDTLLVVGWEKAQSSNRGDRKRAADREYHNSKNREKGAAADVVIDGEETTSTRQMPGYEVSEVVLGGKLKSKSMKVKNPHGADVVIEQTAQEDSEITARMVNNRVRSTENPEYRQPWHEDREEIPLPTDDDCPVDDGNWEDTEFDFNAA